jgi:putative spermidine/putrescine transport system permease protein
MAGTDAPTRRAPRGPLRPVARVLHRHGWLRLSLLLSGPVGWLAVAYLGSLAVLLVSSLWTTDSFTGALIREPTLENFQALWASDVYRTIALRTFAIAAGVTVIDVIIALPMAFYLAKVASPWARRLLVIAVLTPLWASYLVKAYAWRIMLGSGGLVDAVFGATPGYGLVSVCLVLAYLWLPYMILPIYAGLERLPDSLLEASADLGAGAWRTFRSVVLPLLLPSIVAGSVFTFSLSLGDYIAVGIVGGSTQVIGTVIYANVGAANNLPFAAAFATVPVVVMVGYLLLAKRLGAFESM